jgi:choline dehydrogenase-like flavoprotein
MLMDLAQLEPDSTLDADIAIIGAGAAGIALACELAGSGRETWLIESGDFDFDAATQALYAGKNIGTPYAPLDTVRLRYFGGSTNHWGGHCRPLDPIDFERRDWVPHSGWPIERKDLDPFYARAQDYCQLGPYRYDAATWPGVKDKVLPFAPDKLGTRVWQISPPTRFGEVYRDRLVKAPDVRVLMHANVMEIVANADAGAVMAVRLGTLQGRTATLRPRTLIVACGGIENARLLLASTGVEKTGIGNRNDLVGRFFMEHPHALAAYAVRKADLERFALYYGELKQADGTVLHAKPGLAESLQRERRLLSGCVDLGYGYDRSEGYLALRDLGKNLSSGRFERFGRDVLDVLGDLDDAAGGVYRTASHEAVLWLASNSEQVPDPESRVTLGDDKDSLGMRRVKLDWRVSEVEKRNVRAVCTIVGEELARLGLGRLRLDPWLLSDDPRWHDIEGRFHHMGTTRMSDDAKQGVVDRDGRVHGYGNLYIAGSSIFPTSGYANPTLTIVALAIRLADHLKQKGA